jgi:hypothetical protein
MDKEKCSRREEIEYLCWGLSLPFLASSVPLPPVALIIPIFYDRLIDNLSTN